MLAAARRQAQQRLAADVAAQPAELIDLRQRIEKILIPRRLREPLPFRRPSRPKRGGCGRRSWR